MRTAEESNPRPFRVRSAFEAVLSPAELTVHKPCITLTRTSRSADCLVPWAAVSPDRFARSRGLARSPKASDFTPTGCFARGPVGIEPLRARPSLLLCQTTSALSSWYRGKELNLAPADSQSAMHTSTPRAAYSSRGGQSVDCCSGLGSA